MSEPVVCEALWHETEILSLLLSGNNACVGLAYPGFEMMMDFIRQGFCYIGSWINLRGAMIKV